MLACRPAVRHATPIAAEQDRSHRQPVDDVLRLVLGAARMEDAVRFEQPPGLRVDNVGQRTPRQREGTRGERFGAEALHARRLSQVEQGSAAETVTCVLERGNRQRHTALDRQRGSDLHHAGVGLESRPFDDELIGPEGQPSRGDASAGVGVQALMNLVGGADDLDSAGQRQPGRVSNDDTQFARVALRELPGHHKDCERPGEHRDQLWR
jgi:hypothetical protein